MQLCVLFSSGGDLIAIEKCLTTWKQRHKYTPSIELRPKLCLQSAHSNSHGQKYISQAAAAAAAGERGWRPGMGSRTEWGSAESGQTLGWSEGCRRSSEPASISLRWQRQRGKEAAVVYFYFFSNLWRAAGWLQGETVLVSSQTEMRLEKSHFVATWLHLRLDESSRLTNLNFLLSVVVNKWWFLFQNGNVNTRMKKNLQRFTKVTPVCSHSGVTWLSEILKVLPCQFQNGRSRALACHAPTPLHLQHGAFVRCSFFHSRWQCVAQRDSQSTTKWRLC